MAFTRKQVLSPQLLDLNEAVTGIDKMLRRLIGEDVELVTVNSPRLWFVKADPGPIDHMIMNLVVNARDAMPQGGRWTIERTNLEMDDSFPGRHPAIVPGRYVMLAVSDTGTGMTEEVQKRILEPFYTTKKAGEGTGLGLSTVYGIDKQSCGYIWAYSEPGKETTFKVYLPVAEDGVKEVSSNEERVSPTGGSETVLLVEDNESVRSFIRSALESNGFTLLHASGSEDAIKSSKVTAGRFIFCRPTW